MLEKDIENDVVEWARDHGWLAYKFSSPAHRSVPDRIFISPLGQVVFIEFKRPGNRPTKSQAREINRLYKHSCFVEVCDDAVWAIELLQDIP